MEGAMAPEGDVVTGIEATMVVVAVETGILGLVASTTTVAGTPVEVESVPLGGTLTSPGTRVGFAEVMAAVTFAVAGEAVKCIGKGEALDS